MIVKRTLDAGLILDVITDPYIFNGISEDSATFNDLEVDVIKDTWLSIIEDGVVIGCVQFNQKFSKCYDAHIHILKEHRGHSKEAGNKIIEWLNDNMNGITIFANVPDFCMNVIRFLESFDFEQTGLIKKAWLKHDKLNDMLILTRSI